MGALYTVQSALPAAGASPTITVPAGETWLLHGAVTRLSTSATAANRRPNLLAVVGATTIFWCRSGAVQTANVANQDYIWRSLGYDPVAIIDQNLNVAAPFPIPLLGGWVLSIFTTALQAGDQFQRLNCFVEKV